MNSITAPPQRFVVVEDHIFQRQVLCNQIRSLGYSFIFEANTGEQALKICHQHDIDLLFCDLRMPEMDGIVLLKKLSEIEFKGAVVVYSALEKDVIDSVVLMGKTYGLNMAAAISKPASTTQIKLLLDNLHTLPMPRLQSTAPLLPDISPEELRRALDSGIIEPWYQPKVSFKTGEWSGTEALARWLHPKWGFISPVVFIPLAEKYGLIEQLTEVILDKAMKKASAWEQGGLSVNLSVNLSTHTLLNANLPDILLKHCQHQGVSPKALTLEITEGAFIENLGLSLEILSRMRMHGFGISIDDFGTGYSSIQQLTMLPFTELKLDRSFISRCTRHAASMAVVEYSLKLAQQLGLKSVAEGVEDEQTWITLALLGCDMCQGYFSAPPMAGKDLERWHQEWRGKIRTLCCH